jgi:hypothetical protein
LEWQDSEKKWESVNEIKKRSPLTLTCRLDGRKEEATTANQKADFKIDTAFVNDPNGPMKNVIIDNKGRRFGIDRRSFSYAIHLPERRSEQNRRSGFDRRSQVAIRSYSGPTDKRTKHFGV